MAGTIETLRVGFVGSGFVAGFHLQAMLGVRNLRVAGVTSRTAARRDALAEQATEMGLGPCTAYDSVAAMLGSGEIDAVWLMSPNDTRLEVMREIHAAVKAGVQLAGVACEKPLARTLGEAREMLRLAEDAGLSTGYLENQVFAPAVQRGKEIVWRRAVPAAGRPYLARAAEEHSGPHEPWFWQGARQGGGVLSDMMCHSVEVARFMLTGPDEPRETLRPVSASATIAGLKWTRPAYVEKLKREMGAEVDYARHPAEDFARATVVFEDPDGHSAIVEATTSWAYVGPGLRLQMELLGPEYAMEFISLNAGLKVFLSRQVTGSEGEDLVEKQNAEQGLMPVLEDEAAAYGYTAEDRHMVEAFRKGTVPVETFRDGVEVMRLLMALYKSAEAGRTVAMDEDLDDFVPAVARGAWRG